MGSIHKKLLAAVVTLSGAVFTLPSLAQDIASQTETPDRPLSEATQDAWITAKVKADLLATKGVPGTTINVDTKDNVVTLTGHVATQAEADKAAAVATAIKGVIRVDSELIVGSPEL